MDRDGRRGVSNSMTRAIGPLGQLNFRRKSGRLHGNDANCIHRRREGLIHGGARNQEQIIV
jgi:hypothetical protein